MASKTSIIMLTFNNLETATRLCIESLYKYTNENKFELIIVENGSTDGSVEFVQKLEKGKSNVKTVYNNQNLGYSKGNNQGLAIANGDYICLVNNDVLFTPNWLEDLKGTLDEHPEIGLVSPFTNDYLEQGFTTDDYLKKATILISRAKQNIEYRCTCNFCCVLMRREVFQKVGFFDESFSPAYFEDNDYCLRTLYKGYKNALLRKTFIFHNHSQTSSKLPLASTLFEKNKNHYKNKHILGHYILDLEAVNAKLEQQFNKTIEGKIIKLTKKNLSIINKILTLLRLR